VAGLSDSSDEVQLHAWPHRSCSRWLKGAELLTGEQIRTVEVWQRAELGPLRTRVWPRRPGHNHHKIELVCGMTSWHCPLDMCARC